MVKTSNQCFQKPDWFIEKKDYSIRFELQDGDIIYSEAHGALKEQYVKEFFELYRRVLQESNIAGLSEGYFRVSNWEGLKNVSWKARKLYLDGMQAINREFPCRLSVVFGLNQFMNSIISISKQFAPFSITAVKNMGEAKALITQTKKGARAKSKDQINRQGGSKTYTQEELDNYISELLEFIGEIDWHVDKLQEKQEKLVNHPFQPVYELMFVMKQDFDNMLKAKKEAEKYLLIEKSYLEQLFDNPYDAIAMSDKDGRLLRINSAFTRLFGFTEKEALGKDIDDLVIPQEYRSEAKLMRKREKAGEKSEFETRRRHKNGTLIDVSVKVAPIVIDHKRMGSYSVWHDISQRRRAERVQEVLLHISNAITQTLSLEELLSLVQEQVNRLMAADNFYVALINDRKKNLYTFPYHIDENKDEIIPPGLPYPLSRGLTHYVFRTETPLLVDKEKIDALAKKGAVGIIGKPAASWMGVPLRTKMGDVIGVVVVQSYKKTDAYSDNDLEILSIISNTLSIAIEYKQSEEELDKYRERLEKLVEDRTSDLMVANSKLQEEIAERKQTLEALQKSEERFRRLFEDSLDMVFITKPDGTFVKINPAGMELLGFESLEELAQVKASDFYANPQDRVRAKKELEEKNYIKGFEFVLRSKHEKELIVQETTTAVRDRNNDVIEYKGIIRDITDKILKEKQLQEAKEAAEKANRAKTEFLANISHDIRTPLNAILGFSEMIMNTSSPIEDQKYAGQIIAESEVLLNLINDLLDISKVDAGKLALENLPFNLQSIFDGVYSSMGMRAKEKGLQFNISISEQTPLELSGDPNRLRQILVNLVGNAIKFTDHGSVDISVKVQGDLRDQVLLYFAVTDTGIGIERGKELLIFESFAQAEGGTARKYGGTGLGTTISKKLVELMGGSIGVKSRLGEGSTFWFTLPFYRSCPGKDAATREEAGEQSLLAETMTDQQGMILLVEDYPTNREVALTHLVNAGYDVDIAENGEDAVTAAKRKRYDLILMDVRMPGMDGFEATQLIRAAEQKNEEHNSVPIIAMTANVYEQDRLKCLRVGMNDIISKPIRRNHFLQVVDCWLKKSGRGATPPKNSTGEGETAMPKKKDQSIQIGDRPILYERALKEFSNDKELLDSVLKNFISNIEGLLPALDDALAQKDTETLSFEAHKIKGGAANLTAFPLSKAAELLETSADSGDLEEAGRILTGLKVEFARLKESI